MIYNILCIGGPLDGQHVDAEDHMDVYAVRPPMETPSEYGVSEPCTAIEKMIIYEREMIRNSTEVFHIYFHRGEDDVRSMLRRLVDGYQPPPR